MNFIFLLLILLLQIEFFSFTIIVLPFKKYTKYNSKKNYIEYLYKNDLFINFEIGTPSQSIPLFLSFGDLPTYIIGKSLNGEYNPLISQTLKNISFKEEVFFFQKFHKGYIINETIEFKNIKNEKEKIKDISLVLATSFNSGNEIKSVLGLSINGLTSFLNQNLIYELKTNSITESMIWTLIFNNENEGEIIIGNNPHNYNKSYKEEDLKQVKAEKRLGTAIYWDFLFNKVYSNNKLIDDDVKGYLDIQFGLIKGSLNYKKFIEKNFLNETNLCKKNYAFNNSIEYYICDLKSNIKNFPKIIFEQMELKFNFELTYEDVFEKRDDKYYCKIVFEDKNNDKIFVLGQPFLKKYQIVFNADRKLMGIYINQKFNYFNLFLWFIIIILIIIISILLILIYQKYIKKPRKVRANELEEDFLYNIQTDNNNQDYIKNS